MKVAIPVCHHCQKVCGEEIIRFSHAYREGREDLVLLFCSRECWEEHFDLVPRGSRDGEVKKEMNLLYKQVCPACRRRIREKFE
jgi:hypothetical protein